MDSEIINVVVAVAVIYFAVKYITRDKSSNTGGGQNINALLGFKAKKATPEMIDTVHNMFPNIPRENIHFDLLRTGSVDLTVNKLLERGYLDAPSQGYRQAFPAPQQDTPAPNTNINSPQASKPAVKSTLTLIDRFGLQKVVQSQTPPQVVEWDGKGPIPSAAKGKGREVPLEPVAGVVVPPSKWEDTPEKRQANLQSRKQAMILAARQRMLEEQGKGQ